MGLDDCRERSRPLVGGPLTLDSSNGPEAQALSRLVWGAALELLYEDEQHLVAAGREDQIAFGRWLTRETPGGQHLYHHLRRRLDRLAMGLTEIRFAEDFRANRQFTQVTPIATASKLHRTKVFQEWSSRALLLAPLAQAFLTVIAAQPKVAAMSFYSHLDWGGADAHAYGLHRVNTERTVSRLAGLGGLGGDFVTPVTCHPHVTGLLDDPGHPQADLVRLKAMRPELAPCFGGALPSGHLDHLRLHLQIVSRARAVLERAKGRWTVCSRLEVSPERLLERGFPRWLTVGVLAAGVLPGILAPAERTMPGTDFALVHEPVRYGMRPILQLFDTSAQPEWEGTLDDLVFSADDKIYTGRQFARILMTEKRFERIPGLCEEPPAVLRLLGDAEQMRELGVAIDTSKESWLWHRAGLRLLDGRGGGAPLSLVLCSTKARHVGYVTVADMGKPEVRADVIARCHLHLRSDIDETHNTCIPRLFNEHELHVLKSPKYSTRNALRLLSLLTNLSAVGVGRTRQAGLLL